jgi:membrane fusion protein (multidrug efflux system)
LPAQDSISSMTLSRKAVVVFVAGLGLTVLAAIAWFANRGALPVFGTQPAPGGQTGMAGQAGMAGMGGMGGMSGMGGGPPGGMAVGVEAVAVDVGRIVEDVAAVGTLRANESVVLRPEIAGRIARIDFKEGVPAAKGALLIALDASTQAADLQQAQANLALARSNFERTEDLFRKKFVSASAQDQAAANLKVQEATTAQAQARLAKTRIVAPFAGVIGIRNVSVGDYVKEGQDLVNLEDLSALKLDFKLPESYLPRIRRGQSAELTTDARPGETFTAVVDAIDPLIDTAGRAIAVRARLANPDGRLRPGMFARVRLIFGERTDVLMVPEEALVPAGSDQFVFRVADGKAQRVKVATGARRGSKVEVVEGLKAGDLVVTAGQLKVRDGVPVKTVAPAGAAAQ